jgi:hypothetical protein
MQLSLAAAVNNDEIVRSCLLKSPDAGAFDEVLLQRGFDSAATAYNDAVEKAKNDVVVLTHQDVYLPAGWLSRIGQIVERLNGTQPNWAVLGPYGVTPAGAVAGHLYCVANHGILGSPFNEPVEVATLDEVVLLLRKSSGVRFDPDLPGFHFYGTDVCLGARSRHLKCFAVPAFCVHNADEYGMFPGSFWKSYRFMRRKWRAQLPFRTSCIEIESSLFHPLFYALRRFLWLQKAARPLAKRVSDPAALYVEISAANPGI